ncbi:M15 family metallopeptidase [Streptomyces sp. NPDC006627]|uniref:M15 family metallopeptidase n=1 Tax=Streptomyces sp. NPDC006627 TaxID=3154679 RepID=UPI0033B6B7BB
MHRTQPSARTTARRIRWLVVAGLITAAAVITVVIAAALGHQLPTSSSTSASLSASPHASPGEPRGAPDEADGVVPDGTTVFDDSVPAVAELDPGLLKALRRAANAAAGDGVEFSVNSGWRSPAYQDRLLREAVAKYGSKDEAARWVATAATSPHVSGEAVDIGRSQATAWLSRHGADYGLCQIYENEPWHYELRSEAIGHGCPRIYADPTEDPRMQQ